jgi:DNA-binding NarL/FixJ family response regulator
MTVSAGHLALPVDVAVGCEPGPRREELVRMLAACPLLRVRARPVVHALHAVPTGRPGRDGPHPAVLVLRSAVPSRDVPAQVAAGETAPILVVSPVAEDGEIVRTLQSGATSYLVEGEFTAAEVPAAALGTAAGRSHLSPSVLAAVVRRLRHPEHPAVTPGLAGSLSRRERQIMELVAEGHPNSHIARREFIAEKTVRNHLNNIYAKLGVRSRAEAILVWLGHGRPPA